MPSINWFVSIIFKFIIAFSEQSQDMRSICKKELRTSDGHDLSFLMKLEKYSIELYLRLVCFKKEYTEFLNLLEDLAEHFLEDFMCSPFYRKSESNILCLSSVIILI